MTGQTLAKTSNKDEDITGITISDGVVYKRPGEDPKIIRGNTIDKELIKLGLFLELYEIKHTDLIAVFDSRKAFEMSDKKYVFGPLMIMHKGEKGTECLTEDEICCSVIILMDAEVKLSYDGHDFKAFEFR